MFSLMVNCLAMILCVPFLTLFERKMLSYSQLRKGPNKVSILGLLQPISDGLKLILKGSYFPLLANKFLYILSPLSIFFLSMTSMITLSNKNNSWMLNNSLLLFLLIISYSIFPLFFSGVASKSKYSSLGSFRASAQVMAYEVNMVLILFFPLILSKTFSSYYLIQKIKYSWVVFFFVLIFWLYSMLCETNRAPFDFAEGESELVSGFNTEYSGVKFTLLFLAEYSKMVMMSLMTSMMFFKNKVLMTLFLLFFFIWTRTTFPRFRYDLLMVFSWKVMLFTMLFFFPVLLIL